MRFKTLAMEVEHNWSAAVEDLVDGGDVEGAISLLESVVSKLETLDSSPSDLRLALALSDLANLYSSRGLSLKSDQLQTRSFLIKQRAQQTSTNLGDSKCAKEEVPRENRASGSACEVSAASSDDDWEAIADRAPDDVPSPQNDERISKLSLEDTAFQTPKRRGRGTFLYKEDSLYSDKKPSLPTTVESDDEVVHHSSQKKIEKGNTRYGTSHVLVLADFPPITRTAELEKLFDKFRDNQVVIRWVNDTVALAVFRTPSIALEARNNIQCPFTVRVLKEDDDLLSSISTRDLEPPIPRPKTSVRTAQRLIAQGMGRKLSTTSYGSSEFRKQEEARRNRIITRQTMREDAWGAD